MLEAYSFTTLTRRVGFGPRVQHFGTGFGFATKPQEKSSSLSSCAEMILWIQRTAQRMKCQPLPRWRRSQLPPLIAPARHSPAIPSCSMSEGPLRDSDDCISLAKHRSQDSKAAYLDATPTLAAIQLLNPCWFCVRLMSSITQCRICIHNWGWVRIHVGSLKQSPQQLLVLALSRTDNRQ